MECIDTRKVVRIMKKLAKLCLFYREYGFRCFIAKCASDLFPYSDKHKSKARKKILQHKFDEYTNYLAKYYRCFVDSGNFKSDSCGMRGCIWTAWLQGEDKAPEVIRMNLASIRKNAGEHPVVVISYENVDLYLNIPSHIKDKHQNGIIGSAHYADIIRMMLLEKYGGLWLDASMFVYHPIDESAFSSSFYSVGFQGKKGKYVSDDKWVIGIIGGKENSKYLSAISRMLSSYWTEHEVLIDYFVFDYLIAVLYKNDLSFRVIVDHLPRMPFFLNSLVKIINEPYNHSALCEMLPENQVCYLSYRNKYRKITDEGQLTNYGYLFQELFHE